MSEELTGYLAGFGSNPQNHYARPGLFRGSLPAGFVASVLFRLPLPDVLSSIADEVSFLCGNLDYPGVTRGWALLGEAETINQYDFNFTYGDGAEADVTESFQLNAQQMLGLDTLLLQVFFGVRALATGPAPVLAIYANGNAIHINGIGAGYTPASALNPFRIGAGIFDGESFGSTAQIAGFSYFDGAPQSPAGNTAIGTMQRIAQDHWAAVHEAQDMVAGSPEITNLFSVKQRLRNPAPVWPASAGPTLLDRVGDSSLFTLASKPRFLHHPWASQG